MAKAFQGLNLASQGLDWTSQGLDLASQGLARAWVRPQGDRKTNEQTYGRMDGQNFSPFYRTLSPFGAAAQKANSRVPRDYEGVPNPK